MTIAEDSRIFDVEIEPYFASKADGSPYPLGSTILMSINGKRVDYWPSIGPYERTERQAAERILGLGASIGERLTLTILR